MAPLDFRTVINAWDGDDHCDGDNGDNDDDNNHSNHPSNDDYLDDLKTFTDRKNKKLYQIFKSFISKRIEDVFFSSNDSNSVKEPPQTLSNMCGNSFIIISL